MAIAQLEFPVFTAEHVDQTLLNQAARGAVGAEHLFAQDAAGRRQIGAAVIQRYALRIGEIDMAIGIVGQQVGHHFARHLNHLAVAGQNRRQFRGGRPAVDEVRRIDRQLLRTLPRMKNIGSYPVRLLAALKRLPALLQ